jgi:hypothetical protein
MATVELADAGDIRAENHNVVAGVGLASIKRIVISIFQNDYI